MKKIFNLLLTMILFLPTFFVIGCSPTIASLDLDIRISLKRPWASFDNTKYQVLFEKKFNKILHSKKPNLPYVNIDIDISKNSNNLMMWDVATRKSDFAISSITSINISKFKKYVDPILQTKTTAFKFDKNWTKYRDGSTSDPLIQIGNKITQSFNVYQTLKDKDFNGNIYQTFYDLNNFVDFYRGMILICGNASELAQIKNAWNTKNWNSFRNFGIMTGSFSTGGLYKLQESLIVKHFGKNQVENLFIDKLKWPSKYTMGKGYQVGQNDKYHIVFDVEGSFAWTKKRANTFVASKKNMQIEVLTATEPLKYDVGFARKELDNDEKESIVETFELLSKEKKDLYGPKIGYNSYSKIQNKEEEVYSKWKEVLNVKY